MAGPRHVPWEPSATVRSRAPRGHRSRASCARAGGASRDAGVPSRAHTTVLRVAALTLALLGIVPLANLLTHGHEVPWWRGAVILWCAYGALLLAVLWVVAERWGDALDRIMSRAWEQIMRVPRGRFVFAMSALTTLAGIGVSLYCYAGRGFTGDEMAMTWHARMLLAGHLAIPMPANPEFFDTVAMVTRGPRWYSQYPIGGPALLALGIAIKAVWLMNPLLLGVAAWQFHRFARRAFGEPTARAATILFALTPFVLVLGATQMNHTASICLALVALAELAAWDDDGTFKRFAHSLGIGFAVSAIALVRPLDALLVAVPVGVFQLSRARSGGRRFASLLAQCAAGAIPIAILLWANVRTTGNPLVFGYDVANGPTHALGFHLDPNGQMHTPLRGVVYASGYLLRLDRFLFEWPLPGLLIVCAVLAVLHRGTRWDSLLLGLVGAFLLGYGAYWYPGFFDGPRFLFPVVPVFVLYAARMPEAAERLVNRSSRRVARALVPACVLCAWLVPVSFSSVRGRLGALHDQRTKLKTDVAEQVARAGLSNALVLVHEPWRGRLLARLRTIGIQQFEAERIVNTMDACALQTALDQGGVSIPTDTAARRARVLLSAASAGRAALVMNRMADDGLARAPGGPDTPRCREEATSDTLGTMPYAMFLREQRVDRAGHLAGPVIYARDLGARDSLLRAEFGDRRWFLYRPGRSLGDTATFSPIAAR